MFYWTSKTQTKIGVDSRDQEGSRQNSHKRQALHRPVPTWSGIRRSFQLQLGKWGWPGWWVTNALITAVLKCGWKRVRFGDPQAPLGPHGPRTADFSRDGRSSSFGTFPKYWHPGSTLRNHALISLGWEPSKLIFLKIALQVLRGLAQGSMTWCDTWYTELG